MTPVPDLLCIGHLCHDLHHRKNILGGTASYSSIMASHLGLQTGILTSVGEDFGFFDVFEKYQIDICNIPADQTTVFENIYQENLRIQYIHRRASTLLPKHLPTQWQNVPLIKFCLIADEADMSFLKIFPNSLVAATIQGWLRQWDEKGKISPKEMDWQLLRYVDIVFMSEEDITGFETALPKMAELAGLLVMTKGKNGATVFHHGKQSHYPAYPTTEVDPTGAGDIFAASFLVKYHQTNSITQAMAFAHAAASFIVEKQGVQIPPLNDIEGRYNDYLKRYSHAG